MNFRVLIFLSFMTIAVVKSRPMAEADYSDESSSEESYESSEAKYSFNWAVSDDSSSNKFGHKETRDGDDTQGSYYVQLPDGRLQTVKYFVNDDSGYVVEVTYEGEAPTRANPNPMNRMNQNA